MRNPRPRTFPRCHYVKKLQSWKLNELQKSKGKRMEEILNKTSYSKQEEIAGKIYSYVYFFSGLICFFTVIQQYHGTSAIVPFLKDFAVSYSICAFFIDKKATLC